MSALNFSEISPAHKGLERDAFELFAREFLHWRGLVTISGPDCGPDGGRDLIVTETLVGPITTSKRRWLVTCKHNAHSGRPVSIQDDADFCDRVKHHSCDGLIAFYSTVPTSALRERFSQLNENQFPIRVFDRIEIERLLLEVAGGIKLAKRFMPKSGSKWENHTIYQENKVVQPVNQDELFFLTQPHFRLEQAKHTAKLSKLPIFAVLFNSELPGRSNLDYALGYFSRWQITKKLIDQHFIALLADVSEINVGHLLPPNEPLEEPYLIVFSHTEQIVFSKPINANPREGWQTVEAAITAANALR